MTKTCSCKMLLLCMLPLSVAQGLASDKADDSYIDIHFHADARTAGGGDLPKVIGWMETNGVSRLIVLQFEKSLPGNDNEAGNIKENFKSYKGRIYQFCVLLPNEVSNKQDAVSALIKLKSDGAIGFGEHYGRGMDFDDPRCMQLYAACAEVQLPVLFHMDNVNNRDDAALSHLTNALKTYPDCIFIGHGTGFWSKMKTVDELMSKYKNLYADISAGSGARAIGADLKYSRDFMVRHAERVLFGTDCGPWSFGNANSSPQFSLVERLALPPDVKAKLCRENAKALFRM